MLDYYFQNFTKTSEIKDSISKNIKEWFPKIQFEKLYTIDKENK